MKFLYATFPVLFVILIICVIVFGDKKEMSEKNQIKISEFKISEMSVKNHNYLFFEKNGHNFKQLIHSPDCFCNKK